MTSPPKARKSADHESRAISGHQSESAMGAVANSHCYPIHKLTMNSADEVSKVTGD